jgi:hypothetical protein
MATIAPKPSKESMLKIRSFQPADSEAVRPLFTQGHLLTLEQRVKPDQPEQRSHG